KSLAYPRERLVATRRSELIEAAAILGVGQNRLFELGLQDAATPKDGPEFDKALTNLEAIVGRVGARGLFVTWEHDPHCAHEAASQLARALRQRHPKVRLWSYPVWGWHLPPLQPIA